eukprot:TRINITY_DN504_c1_g1_i10.p4 TRINITY_DN504_c1_g1~~TRINITY_DN504_c1_g1_i10.p4  ORF type:complete len:179 (+),score=67.03 TRINITY_DN504_c1_g1_i10:2-538(+)
MDEVVQRVARMGAGGGSAAPSAPSAAASFVPPLASSFSSSSFSAGSDLGSGDAAAAATGRNGARGGGGRAESTSTSSGGDSGGAYIGDSGGGGSTRAKLVLGKRQKAIRIDLQCGDLYAWMCERARQRFPKELGGGSAFEVTYKDEDGEEYNVDCDEDVREAVESGAGGVVPFYLSSL